MADPPGRGRPAVISGTEIRRAREMYRMTQVELAGLLGVSARTVSNWERNSTVPRNRNGALSDVLGVLCDRSEGGEPLLSQASQAELLAEIARRLSDLAQRSPSDPAVESGGKAEGPPASG